VARQGCVSRNVGSLAIADLTHEHDVRVLTEKRPKGRSERQTYAIVDLYLRYAAQLVLDGILDGENLLAPGSDVVDRGLQRSGLARSCRTGGEDDTMRPRDGALECGAHIVGHADLLEADPAGLLVQEAEHDTFAMQRGQCRHVHVHLPVPHTQPDPAVLRLIRGTDIVLRA
jgi:hypothetical protein